jgi:hypothetical protein
MAPRAYRDTQISLSLLRKTRNTRKGQPDGCCFFCPNQTNPNKPDFKHARSQNKITLKAWNITGRGVNLGKIIRLFQLNPNGVAHIIVWVHPFRVRFIGGQQNRGSCPCLCYVAPLGLQLFTHFSFHHNQFHRIACFYNVNI